MKGWRVMSWGPGPKDSTAEPEPMWRDGCRGKSIHTPPASISPLYDQTLSVYRFLKKLFLTFLFIGKRQRETEHEQRRGRERGRHRIRSGLRAVSTAPDAGLELTKCEIMT